MKKIYDAVAGSGFKGILGCILFVCFFAGEANAQEVKTICPGESVTLYATTYGTTTWSPADGLSATTGSTVIASPAITTTYTVTSTSNQYSTTKTITVVIKDVAVSPAEVSLCSNATAPVALTASDGTPSGQLLIDENFDEGVLDYPFYYDPLPDWTIDNAGSTQGAMPWYISHIQNGDSQIVSTTTTGYSNTIVVSKLTSPAFSTSGYEDVVLTFNNSHGLNPGDQIVALEISTDNGVTWSVLQNYIGLAFNDVNESISLNGYLNQDALKLRFNYRSTATQAYGYWRLNNLKVTATRPRAVWSPQTGLFTDASGTVPYVGEEVHEVYAQPDSNTTYTVSMNSGGCPVTGTSAVTIVAPPANVEVSGNDAVCLGASTVLTATGADSYTWSPATGLNSDSGAEVIASPTETTTYTVTGTTNGCSTTNTFTVTVNALPVIDISPASAEICIGSSTIITVSGAATYQWSPADGLSATTGAEVTASPATTTTYTVTGTTADGCTASAEVTITVNSTTISLTPSTVLCSGNAMELAADGAVQYAWSPAEGLSATYGPTVTALPAVTTTYTVTGTSASGCTDTKSVTITVEQPITVASENESIYLGQSTTLTANGAQTYSWSPAEGLDTTTGPGVVATPEETTTYTVTGTTASGCITSAQITVTVTPSPDPVANAAGPTQFCPGQSVVLTASIPGENPAIVVGPSSYSIFNPELSNDFTIECWLQTKGSYTTVPGDVWNYKGALFTTYDPSYNPAYTVAVNNGKLVFGYGFNTTEKVTSLSNVNTGDWVHIAVTRSLSTGELKIFVNGNEEASVITGNQIETPISSAMIAGGYGVSGSIDNLRIWNTTRTAQEIQQHINVSPDPGAAGLTADFHFDEGSGNNPADSSGNASYFQMYSSAWSSRPDNPGGIVWSNGATGSIIEVTDSGSYTVAYENYGVTLTSNAIAVNVDPLVLDVNASASEICAGESVQLNVTASDPAAYFTWSPATGLSNPYAATTTASPLETTTYTVYGTTSGGCSTTETITVQVSDGIVLVADNTALCGGAGTTITASGGDEYSWSPSTGLDTTTGAAVVATPTETTTYTVTSTTPGGCLVTKDITIEVRELTAAVTAPSFTLCGGMPLTLSATSNFDNPALEFSGDDSAMIFAQIFSDFTIEFWMKTVQTGNSGAWDNGSVIFGTTKSGAQPFYGISVSGSKLAFGLNSDATLQNTTIHSTSDINDGQWKHVAITRSMQTGLLQLYIDGQLEADVMSADMSQLMFYSGNLGRLPSSPNSFAGSMDDLKFWSSVRTPTQILESSVTATPPGTPNLVSYFPFNENTGSAFYDDLNQGMFFNVVGTPTWSSRTTTPLTYLWSNGATTPKIEVADAGTYSVIISSDVCTATSPEVVVSESTAIPGVTAPSTVVCRGDSVLLTATGGDTYNWMQAPGLTSFIGEAVMAVPQSTTTYSVMISTGGGCQSIQTITITVENPVTIVPDAASVCINSAPVQLTVVGGNNETVILGQDFNSGLGVWTFDNASDAATNWQLAASPYLYGNFPISSANGGMMLLSDSGAEPSTNTTIISPVFSTAGYTNAVLTFETIRLPGMNDTTATLDISTDGGSTWSQLKNYGGAPTFTTESIDLAAYVDEPAVRLRFVNIAGSNAFWMIDGLRVATFTPDPVTWSPFAGLFADAAGMQPYTGEPTNIVYAKPGETTEYTAASPAETACGNPAVTVAVVSAGSGTVSPDQALCAGSTPSDLQLSGNSTTILKWQKATDAAFTDAIDINSTSATLPGSEVGYIGATTYVRAVLEPADCGFYSAYAVLTVNLTTWNGTEWSNGTPESYDYSARINGNYNSAEDGNITACSLIISSGEVVIAGGGNFTIKGIVTVDNDNASLTVEHNANLIQEDDVDNIGTITVIKESAPMYRLDYAMWASPVAGQRLKAFSPQTLDNRFYSYNPLSDAYAPVQSPAATDFAEGKGYLIRVENTHPAYVEGEDGTSWTGTFEGVPNNGTVDVAVIPNSAPTDEDANGVKGFNAIGNPYPSSINIEAFFEANQNNLSNTSPIYFWRKKNEAGTSSYASLTLAGYNANSGNDFGDSSNGVFDEPNDSENWVINPGQGFIVKAVASTVTFNNQIRRAVNNGQMFRSAQDAADKSRLWLNLTNAEGAFGQTTVAYTPATTLGLDFAWDGQAMTDGEVAIYSLAGDVKLGIQARPAFDPVDEVPLEFKITTAGNYTISLDHFDGVFETGQAIYLRDNLLVTTHNLESPYEFTTDGGIITARFDVVYAEALGTDNPTFNSNSIIVYKQGNAINISTGNVDMKSVAVYDVRGRLLYSSDNINAAETSITTLQAQEQMLIVQVTTAEGNTANKKIIF